MSGAAGARLQPGHNAAVAQGLHQMGASHISHRGCRASAWTHRLSSLQWHAEAPELALTSPLVVPALLELLRVLPLRCGLDSPHMGVAVLACGGLVRVPLLEVGLLAGVLGLGVLLGELGVLGRHVCAALRELLRLLAVLLRLPAPCPLACLLGLPVAVPAGPRLLDCVVTLGLLLEASLLVVVVVLVLVLGLKLVSRGDLRPAVLLALPILLTVLLALAELLLALARACALLLLLQALAGVLALLLLLLGGPIDGLLLLLLAGLPEACEGLAPACKHRSQ